MLRTKIHSIKNLFRVLSYLLLPTFLGSTFFLLLAGALRAQTSPLLNPAINLTLQGHYLSYSQDHESYNISGFDNSQFEGSRSPGFSLGGIELEFSSNIDTYFYGHLTLGIHGEESAVESGAIEVAVELEEAYLKTLNLGKGTALKFGRMFLDLGYLNNYHSHDDYFVLRPLVNRAFLQGQHVGDGFLLTALSPSKEFFEVGLGAYRGGSYPSTSINNGASTGLLFLRTGGDTAKGSWKLGLSYLITNPRDRDASSSHGHDEEDAEHDDEEEGASGASGASGNSNIHNDIPVLFSGLSSLYVLDFKARWSPNRNFVNKGIEFRSEFFYREEYGDYSFTLDPAQTAKSLNTRATSFGYYVQVFFKFTREISFGYRYDELRPIKDFMNKYQNQADFQRTLLNSSSNERPHAHTLQFQYSFSEFSRVRAGYTRDASRSDKLIDNIYYVDFVASFGRHRPHKF